MAWLFAVGISGFELLMPTSLLLAALAVFMVAVKAMCKKSGRFCHCLIMGNDTYYKGVLLFLTAGALALLLRAGYDYTVIRPAEKLAGQNHAVKAMVMELSPGYSPDTVFAVLELQEADGVPVSGIRIRMLAQNKLKLGDVVQAEIQPDSHSPNRRYSMYAMGVQLKAYETQPLEITGSSHSPATRMRELQYLLGDAIYRSLPGRLSSAAAAMSVGDSRRLDQETVSAYRGAGLSHVLVISGGHVSAVCGAVFFLLSEGGVKRKKFSAWASIFTAVLFVCVAGFTPSLVRAALVYIFVFSGMLLGRKSDVYTSMGLAALALCLQNPYCVMDAGLQLSFAASLGALTSAAIYKKLRKSAYGRVFAKEKPPGLMAEVGDYFLKIVLATVVVHAFILPVLALESIPVSLVAVAANMVALPLLPLIILFSLIMAVPAGIPLLGLLSKGAAVFAAVLLRLLEAVAGTLAQTPWSRIYIQGYFAVAVLAAVYLLGFLAFRSYKKGTKISAVVYGVFAVAVFPAALVANSLLTQGTVKIFIAGAGPASSMVAVKDGSAVVLYRSRTSIYEIQRILDTQHVKQVEYVADLRKIRDSQEHIKLFSPGTAVNSDNFTIRHSAEPLEGINVYLVKQPKGVLACVETGNVRTALVRGSFDLTGYGRVDYILPGAGEISGTDGSFALSGAVPEWAEEYNTIQGDSGMCIWIRPGKGVKIHGARQAADGM